MPRRPEIPKSIQVAVYRRDGWLCRHCKQPVILHVALKYIERELRKEGIAIPLAYHHPNWSRAHAPLLDQLGAVADHTTAFSAGGPTRPDNLVTSCNKCNARKSAKSLAIWSNRLKAPPVRGRYGEPQAWDGLSTLFVVLAKRHPEAMTESDKAWFRALA